jgi:hypothetical protein
MSKFMRIDDWETVDGASVAHGAVMGADPLTMATFSLFMEGQAATPPQKPDAETPEDNDPITAMGGGSLSAGRPKKSAAAVKNIMDAPRPSAPSWWVE